MGSIFLRVVSLRWGGMHPLRASAKFSVAAMIRSLGVMSGW